jgi:tripartite-type tricarboxylate transporter receptor subunit TctC
MRNSRVGTFVAATLYFLVTPAGAQETAADFYRGKTMKVVVGFPPGGGFDLYARIISEHLPRFIPGAPKIVVENMPGAATARAAAHVFKIAPQDGTVLGLFHHALLADQALATKPDEFDITKFNWIGRMATRLNVGVTSAISGVKTIADARKTEVVMGATAPTATSAMVPRAINRAAGTLFKTVLGYQGSADMTLAMERGEIGGFATAAWRDISRDHADWIKTGKVNVVFQISTKGASDLAHAPALPELATTDDDRIMLDLLARTEDMGRAFPVGPGVPADRVALLRQAFASMMADPAYLADASKYDFETNFMSGEALQSFVASVGALSRDQRDRIRKVLMP